ncbi:O-antigen ligase family protein [Microbacterium fluvii]|uniref:O-antigen ligase family protein n=1 Tax=Microbacterium fluvii TaxID=415215 RepID=A0ABW2H881_9MICO|nr:O-antigen ligase family protein [Microbacterium fluvii]MCU4671193.1 O-antigen ligase family protein [Microbacterium fluvii]
MTVLASPYLRVRDPRVAPTSFQIGTHSAIVVAALFVLQFPQFLTGNQSMMIMGALLALSLLSWPRTHPLMGPFIGLVVLAAFSSLWSEHPSSALTGALQFAIVASSGIAVGAALNLNRILQITSRTAGAIALLSLVLAQVAPHIAIHSGPAYSGTLQGIFISKNSLAIVVIFGAVSTLFLRWPRTRDKWEFTLLWAVFLITLVQTDSATADLILAVVVVLRICLAGWLKMSGTVRAATVALLLVPVIVIALSSWAIYTGTLGLLGRDTTLTGRTDIWEAAVLAWQTRPWLGVGWGSFSSDSTLAAIQEGLYGWVRDHAHNGFIQVLTELGLVGIIVLAWTLLLILARSLRAISHTRTLIAGWPIAVFATFVMHNAAEQSMRLLPLFMLAVAAAAAVRVSGPQPNIE